MKKTIIRYHILDDYQAFEREMGCDHYTVRGEVQRGYINHGAHIFVPAYLFKWADIEEYAIRERILRTMKFLKSWTEEETRAFLEGAYHTVKIDDVDIEVIDV
ncbi:MAG: hypothetical protein K8L99_02430 [Anaerolineae bacterium]|nr:hypothetical protein [Anaerolineae bacterium]